MFTSRPKRSYTFYQAVSQSFGFPIEYVFLSQSRKGRGMGEPWVHDECTYKPSS